MKTLASLMRSTLIIGALVHSSFTFGQDYYLNNECCPASCCCDYTYDFKVSYLYWGAYEDQLTYAADNVVQFNPPMVGQDESDPSVGLKTNKDSWGSGVRLEGGISHCSSPWSLRGAWTYLKTDSHSHVGSGEDQIRSVVATTVAPLTGGFILARTASSSWEVNVNELAFDLDYKCHCSPCLEFSPYMGIMAAVIDQKQHIDYNDINSVLTNIGVHRKNDFWGIGPRVGFGLNWKVWKCLSLISNANAGFLYGQVRTHNHVNLEETIVDNVVLPGSKQTLWRGRPMTSGLVGLEWDQTFCGCYQVSFSLAYEAQYWWQQWHNFSNSRDYLSGEGKWGDLFLQGVTVSAGISF